MAITPAICQNSMDLARDKGLNKSFNENEIKGLEAMVQYVDNMVLKKTNKTEVHKAYHIYFENWDQTSEYSMPFKENEKYPFLKSLDSSTFSSIWIFQTHVDMISVGDTIYRNLENFEILQVKPYSKYMNYLKEVGQDDSYFKKLHLEFESIGNLSTASSFWFPKNHTNFDFTIPKNRLWAVVYLLRIEEPFKMKLERYFKNK